MLFGGVVLENDDNKGLENILKEITPTEEKIIYVDVYELESNPKNFYGLRDIDGLAGLIAVSHFVEPLTVFQKADGKYVIISGHRRRAAIQKLLEDGVYNERKLPCIVKTPEKISIEQDNGETVEFDEDAVNMLHLIASNRGQREERTVEEKLQEIRFLEKFAKAIYHQKDRGTRGRFRTFFAEEILNISKSQLQRLNSMEKLTDEVKQAVDDKKISETAAMELATMTPEEQNASLEKILSGEVKGTVQEIQNMKAPKTEVAAESETEKIVEKESVVEKLTYPKNLLPQKTSSDESAEKIISVGTMIEVPEEFEDPQKEAEEWFYKERLAFYEMMYNEAKRRSEEETNELKAAQWGIRASVARYNIEELKLQHSG